MRNDKSFNGIKKDIENANVFAVLEFIRAIESIDDVKYFLEQKIYYKIYNNSKISVSDKCVIKETFVHYVNETHIDFSVKQYVGFVEMISNLSIKIYNEIKETIESNFTSLMYFSSYLDFYMCNKNEDILFVRKLLFNIASKLLHNDFVELGKRGFNIFYDKQKHSSVKKIIKLSIEYGCLSEQFDDVSYLLRKVENAENGGRPELFLKLIEPEKEYCNAICNKYNFFIYQYRCESNDNVLLNEIYYYYKCLICKTGFIRNKKKEEIDFVQTTLRNKYSMITTTDYLFFITSDYPSYIMSIVTYLYSRLLCLFYFSSINYQIISTKEIKKNMLFGLYITDDDFDKCIKLISINDFRNNIIMKTNFPFIFINDSQCLISKWMYSDNFDILGDVKDICFNSQGSKELGKIANIFGKKTFEALVKDIFVRRGWIVANKGIRIKSGGQIVTDIDLLSYRNGILLIGQIKLAHCGYSIYQKWKAEKTILAGINQCNRTLECIKNTGSELEGILKSYGLDVGDSEVENVVSIVISGSNNFTGMPNDSNVCVIGIEMLDEILCCFKDEQRTFLELLKNPLQLFASYIDLPTMKFSEINTKNYNLVFEEIE